MLGLEFDGKSLSEKRIFSASTRTAAANGLAVVSDRWFTDQHSNIWHLLHASRHLESL